MKYNEMVDTLKSHRTEIQEQYKEQLFQHIHNGIMEFGKVYANPSTWTRGIKVRRTEDYYSIEINEKLWLNLSPLLIGDFNVHEINKNAYVIILK